MREVDAIEQHGELGGVELGAERALMNRRQTEATLLEALVGQEKSTVVPGEDLHPVTSLRDEDEEVPCVEVLLPLSADDGGEPVDRIPHVDRLGSEEDADRAGKDQHPAYPMAASSSAR